MPTATLDDTLRRALHDANPPALCVAFSGGPDSSALLHALARLPEVHERGFRALHVDHGLHPDSAAWTKHCAEFCGSLDIPFTALRASVEDAQGEGIEASARRARYAAFAEHLGAGEWLVLAHHRDDQIETVLLKLLRGAGPEGLGGMRELRPFAHGMLWRPLLGLPRAALLEYLERHGIRAIDDPANADPRFTRNVLRHDILPRIVKHWPHADASILHSAALCRVSADHLDRETGAALATLWRAGDTLDAAGWLALPPALRAPALNRWLRSRGVSTPADTQRRELEHQATNAGDDRVPCIAWHGGEVHVWDGRLHALPALPPVPDEWRATWDGAPLTLPDRCGTLATEPLGPVHGSTAKRFDPPLVVRFRQGGERIKPYGDTHTRELRDLFQHARMPPWLRVRCPLVFERDELVAVADLWTSTRGKAIFEAHGMQPCWKRPAWAERNLIS